MRFWVKKYERGEVGRWFHRRKVGETVEIRGPVRTFEWDEGAWDEVVMVSIAAVLRVGVSLTHRRKISGGTGITPVYQLLFNAFGKKSASTSGPNAGVKSPHITLMHASSSTETLPPSPILDDIQRWAEEVPERLTFKTFLGADGAEGSSSGKRIDVESIEATRLERGLAVKPSWLDRIRGITREPEVKKKVLFVVCGPER